MKQIAVRRIHPVQANRAPRDGNRTGPHCLPVTGRILMHCDRGVLLVKGVASDPACVVIPNTSRAGYAPQASPHPAACTFANRTSSHASATSVGKNGRMTTRRWSLTAGTARAGGNMSGGSTSGSIGGSAGIGLETARRARGEAAGVILTGRNRDRLQQAAAQVGAQRTAAFDANDTGALQKFFQELPTPIADGHWRRAALRADACRRPRRCGGARRPPTRP